MLASASRPSSVRRVRSEQEARRQAVPVTVMSQTDSKLRVGPDRRRRPRFSLAMLLLAVIVVAVGLAVRQAVLVPIQRRAAIRENLAAAGLEVTAVAPARSWRNWVFADEDLLEVTAVTVPDGRLPPGTLAELPRLPRLSRLDLFDGPAERVGDDRRSLALRPDAGG